jgi:hypothetical protein
VSGPADRVEIARDYLASVRQHEVTHLPPSVLVRECAELRRQLGLVLDLIDGLALTPEQRALVLDALADAAGWRELRGTAVCQACAEHPAELCSEHQADLDRVDAYRALAARIGGQR